MIRLELKKFKFAVILERSEESGGWMGFGYCLLFLGTFVKCSLAANVILTLEQSEGEAKGKDLGEEEG